jgi:hypothetical protein
MTVHASYTHQCPACEAFYMPFDQVPCPWCGLIEKERDEFFIPLAVSSVRWNIQMDGSYVPGAWFVGGLGDHLLLIVFYIFERWREHPEHDFPDAVEKELSPRDWGDQAYLKNHVATMSERILQELNRDRPQGDEPPADEPLKVKSGE